MHFPIKNWYLLSHPAHFTGLTGGFCGMPATHVSKIDFQNLNIL